MDEQGRIVWVTDELPEFRGKVRGKHAWHWLSDREQRVVREAICQAALDGEPAEYSVQVGDRIFDCRLERVRGVVYSVAWSLRPAGLPHLTAREVEILRALCADETTLRTAHRLGIQTSTVESHRRSLRKKTGTKTAAGLALWAVSAGLVQV